MDAAHSYLSNTNSMNQSTRLATLSALIFLGLVFGSSGEAAAETVKARRTANVYASTGERSKVVTTVRAGKTMTVKGKKGRWLKVRANGRTGWIVRTNVVTKQARKNPKPNRRKAFVKGRARDRDLRRRSGPKDRLGLDATNEDDDFADGDDGDDDDGFEEEAPRKRSKKKRKKRKRKRVVKKKKKKKRKKVVKKKKDFDEFGDDDDDDDDLGDDDDDDDDDRGDDDDDLGEDLGEDDEPVDEREVVSAALDIELKARRSRRADEVGFAEEGAKLFVVSRKGKWVEVENVDGETGWVRKNKVVEGSSGSDDGSKKTVYTANAGLGFVLISQTFTSDSTANATFDNYKIGSRAAGIALGGTALHKYSADIVLGGDVNLGYAISTPGIRVSEGGMTVDTGFSILDFALIGKGGYKVHPDTKTTVFGRFGLRYNAFLVKNVQDIAGVNLAALPSEALKGPVVGIEVDTRKVVDKVSANFKLDTMFLLASRSQTGSLEDGQNSSTKALTMTLTGVYAYQPNLRILGGYQFGWAKTKWNGAAPNSMRKHNATSARRSDRSHMLSVGAVRDF